MPPLVSHMVVARRAAARLGEPPPIADWGAFLLGATSPDIRVLTQWERERTHFYDLEQYGHQDSVAAFFRAHPRLRDAAVLNESTVAWVGGFLTHLVMDENYIAQVYRPFFGAYSPLGGTERAHLLDRILQYEFDRREREEGEAMAALREALGASALEIESGFIDRATLEQWRQVCISVTEHPPDWERFTKVASRHLRKAGIESPAELEGFLEQVPELLEETRRSVDMACVESFFEETTDRTVGCLREYLACP